MYPLINSSKSISIHAPTRGATRAFEQSHHTSLFQSTLPQGERREQAENSLLSGIFQSTLPQGERRLWLLYKMPSLQFQSTLPQGERRQSIGTITPHITISIHAPTRGATFLQHFAKLFPRFQSTLPQGERPRQRL